MNPPHTSPCSASSYISLPPKSSPFLPPELWVKVCSFLQRDRREEFLRNEGSCGSGGGWCRHSLESFGLTCKALYHISLPAWKQFVQISWWTAKWVEELNERRRAPEALMFHELGMLPERAFHQLNHSTELVIWRRCIYKNELEAVLGSLSLRRLTLRSVNAEKRFTQEPTHVRQLAIHSKSKIQALDLSYPTEVPINFPQELAPLVLISSLETLLTTPKSFKGIGQFLATITLPLPRIRHLSISSDACPGSMNKLHLLSFLHRCPTLETLHISYAILSRALTDEDLPANLPNLETYEGRQDYIPYFHAPSFRRALVKHFPWDGGALIDALASMSTDLESLVIELTSKLDDPAMIDIKASFRPHSGDYSYPSFLTCNAPTI